MKRSLLIKLGLIAVVVLASIFFLIPPSKTIRLGLDLQGGLHLVLEVQVEKAVERSLERSADLLFRELQDKGLSVVTVEPQAGQNLRMTFSKPPDSKLVEETARSAAALSDIRQQSPEVWIGTVPAAQIQDIRAGAVDQALEKIRNRIDAFGVSEPSISREGVQRIVVQLPGLKDTQRAIDLIGKTAQLELKLVQSQATTSTPPPGTQILYQSRKDPNTKQLIKGQPYVVEKRARITGDMLESARAQPDSGLLGQYEVLMQLNSRGKRLFAKLTEENVGRSLAIVLDDTIFSAPVIQEPIREGTARISGTFTPEEARDLAIVLREGALPAPVTIVENRTIGPSLGSDSITQGVRSTLLGGALIAFFMLVYYRASGLLANTTLALNLLILMGFLAVPGLGATLTLPGIAGIILTLGMAVDSNVLIFERIREELRIGKPVQAAVDAGFERALSAILDSNVTTIISAIVLFQFGSGPIKGFAVTLTIGLLASMFTAVFVSRTIYEAFFSLRRVNNLSI